MTHNAVAAISDYNLIDTTVIVEESDVLTQASFRKLARLRKNLEALRTEISEKILDGASGCRIEAQELVKDLHATLSHQNK